MSGHSKWSTIKHKKGAADARRGKVFTKLIKEITISARLGGGDPAGTPERTVADIRHIFSKNAGNLGEAGCVSWMFEKRGLLVFEKGKVDEEKLMNLAVEAGAQDGRDR